jgi:hypothetical protein
MRKRFRKAAQLVEFCERSGKVCGNACRQTTIIERARDRALMRGWKYA